MLKYFAITLKTQFYLIDALIYFFVSLGTIGYWFYAFNTPNKIIPKKIESSFELKSM